MTQIEISLFLLRKFMRRLFLHFNNVQHQKSNSNIFKILHLKTNWLLIILLLPAYHNLCLFSSFFFFFNRRQFIKKKGRNNVTVDDLVHVITPKGRGKNYDPFFLNFFNIHMDELETFVFLGVYGHGLSEQALMINILFTTGNVFIHLVLTIFSKVYLPMEVNI